MSKLYLSLVLLAFGTAVHAQSSAVIEKSAGSDRSAGNTMEGFWQDSARRILFARDAPASYVYGRWSALDLEQTYPSAKRIRRTATGFELVDLLYGDEYAIRVLKAGETGIEFTRSSKFPPCAMHHACRLEGNELLCSLENICRVDGRDVLDWRGEERYVRRTSCESGPRREAQGIPTRCR